MNQIYTIMLKLVVHSALSLYRPASDGMVCNKGRALLCMCAGAGPQSLHQLYARTIQPPPVGNWPGDRSKMTL